ncbi:pantoate--beta-alanine ligase [Devosia nitrariae]|uniref:Pantothenate synthetase n=1 Tax=Devosia nitrariae TaxID=2071872 RepID=A0ABQ5W4B3_9HYPH|nr:pantoate--beta-alanine ligase [Devosia nitrariae]GLQ54578.1 pantothenate synthetase [Devosia nitrariae]
MTQVLRSVAELRSWRKALPPQQSLGLVPTMGALHRGHMSLVELSQERCDTTLVSIFVNPLQFGPSEDLAKYPRPLEADLALLEAVGVDALFLPGTSDLYPPGASTFVVEESVSAPLCGAFRPGHFRGVATVVLKLFNLSQPHVAFFGQKDAQQCAVIERMVRDLDVPVEIVRGPIVRESDGLALSSRNVYLNPAERAAAPRLFESLNAAQAAYAAGERRADRLVAAGRAVLASEPLIRVQYWEVRDPVSLDELERIGEGGALLAVAAHLGATRLIDNIVVG